MQSVKEACKHSFNKGQKSLKEREAIFWAICQEAIDDLETARTVWHQKKDAVNSDFNSAKAAATAKLITLQADADAAERSFKNHVANLTRELEQTRSDATAAVKEAEEAEQDLNNAQRDSNDGIREAQEDLHQARKDFERDPGNAVQDLEGVRHDMESIHGRVNELNSDDNSLNRHFDCKPWYNCPPLIAEQPWMKL